MGYIVAKVTYLGFVGEGGFGDHDRNCSREPDHDRDHNRSQDVFSEALGVAICLMIFR